MADLFSVFVAVFVAELGDKTQLAALLFTAERALPPWAVFLAASAALVASTGMAVAIGAAGAKLLEGLPLKLMAGIAFMVIGSWILLQHFRGA